MSMSRLLPALALLAGLVAPALAQPPAVNPAARAEAERTLGALNMAATMEATMSAVRPQLVAQMQQAGRVDEARAAAAVDELILPAMRGAVPQMMAGIADIWARHYTVEDLRGLQAFYQSPVGRKSLQLAPVLTRETLLLQQTLLPGILQDAMARNADALRGRGINLN
ncbi:MAG TPA: DUF2059 domain-containing protein [Roseococcus sp.]|jgi:hypothetical protein|nr:DUF2059 domain-containing protein [Roseococcus sp.]